MIETRHDRNTGIKPLVFGFIFSLISTLAVYLVAAHIGLRHERLVATVIGFGSIQAILQLIFFFHIGSEPKPRWSLLLLVFTIVLVLVVVLGTLWIMYNLDYNLMPAMDTYGCGLQ
ncbi:MAG: cytochrome C oxidase subunit IV family protein [Chlamydiota bacterium]